MAKTKIKGCCPICGSECEISAESMIGFNGMLEDLEGYSVARLKCNCGFETSISVDEELDEEGLNNLIESLKSTIKNNNFNNINPALVGAMLLFKLQQKNKNLTIEYVKSIIKSL